MAASTGLQERVALWNDGRRNDPQKGISKPKTKAGLTQKKLQAKKEK